MATDSEPVSSTLDGFDPLDEYLDPTTVHATLIQESTRRVVQNILKSYTGFFDIFNETIQNALDAIDLKLRDKPVGYHPKLHIVIDIPRRIVRVIDNGIGMDDEEFRLCFRPNTSFKTRRESRGHKGVGATFLAYGFSMISMMSKKSDIKIAAALRGGREWSEERTSARPRLEIIEFNCPELLHESSGTSVEILIPDAQRPKLSWLMAKSADAWYDVLRIRTPLGGVYLTKSDKDKLVEPEVFLTLVATDGDVTDAARSNVEYYYPHEMPIFDTAKVKTVGDIQVAESKLSGNVRARADNIPESLKRLEAIWEIWDYEQLIAHPTFSKELSEEQKTLLAHHKATVYGFFISSARLWKEFQTSVLQVHSNARLLEGGLQIASDHMVQGDLMVIPLTSAAGYHRHAHIVVHFRDGNPDLGRKVFQPELKEVAEELARRAVDVFRSYKEYMKGDSGAPPQRQQDRHFEWLVEQRRRRDEEALTFEHQGRRIPMITAPRQEQEVIGLFNQLLGADVLKGIQVISMSIESQYDCSYCTSYDGPSYRFDSESNPLGVSTESVQPDSSKPLTLEFKYNLDGLASDFDNNVKYPAEIDSVVVWELGSYYKAAFEVSSLLVMGAGSSRRLYGATHRISKLGGGTIDVICLSDLLRFLQEPDRVEAEHRVQFGA